MGQWWVLPPHGPDQCGETVGPAEGEGGFVTPQETELRKAVLNPCWSPPAAARETSQWTGSLSAVGSQGQQLDGLFTATSSFAGHRSPRGTFKCKREDRHPGSQRGAHPTRQPKIQDRKHSITQSLKIVRSWWIRPPPVSFCSSTLRPHSTPLPLPEAGWEGWRWYSKLLSWATYSQNT